MNTITIIFFILYGIGNTSCQKQPVEVHWPEITNEAKPWTRWWWMGSAVDKEGLTANMQEYAKTGFGGLEITPIYGMKGEEDKFIEFLSVQWIDMLSHTLDEGQRLNLGIDLANASGWPFGGSWIGSEDACKYMIHKKYVLKGGQRLTENIQYIQHPIVRAVGHEVNISEVKYPINSNGNLKELALDQVRFEKGLPLQTLMAYSNTGQVLEVTGEVREGGVLDWVAPEGEWELYALFQGWHGKQVERAGPGGEGNVIDHFSKQSIDTFLRVFDKATAGKDIECLRAFFNDSYEVDDAYSQSNWTPLFFEEFEERRGYSLKNHLPALFGNDTEEMNSRVLCDYRETISDLILQNFTIPWAGWAKKHDAIIRNQAHGSPANILDLYAASNIPETEGVDALKIKFASSAGHVTGKRLVSCEAATWLDEHFLSNLADVKKNLDRYLANGVNHIVYHGSPYSPPDAEWPGCLFYASVHFAPTNSLWGDLKAINEYVANCQSFLQSSTPNNDFLLYFPIYGRWSTNGGEMLQHFEGGAYETSARELGQELLEAGYTFDFISDKQILRLRASKKLVRSGDITYKTILIPPCDFIPLQTLEKLVELAENGATVIFRDALPQDVPGFYDLENRQAQLKDITNSLKFVIGTEPDYSVCNIGKGKIFLGENVEVMLKEAGVINEAVADDGLWFSRVRRHEGTCYFISNWGGKKIDKLITFNAAGKAAAIFDPIHKKMGEARMQKVKKVNKNRSGVYIQLQPGESRIIQFYDYNTNLEDFPIYSESEKTIPIEGEWTVSYVSGGPAEPKPFETTTLPSWVEISEKWRSFSGTAKYSITFNKPKQEGYAYRLNLGEVHETARVILNGAELGVLVGPEYTVDIPAKYFKEENLLEILVSNLMANRIIDMEKKGIEYKKFYNINFAARDRENRGGNGLFTAAHWEPLESGLIGPTTFTLLGIQFRD